MDSRHFAVRTRPRLQLVGDLGLVLVGHRG